MMVNVFSLIRKKKITEDKVANIFTNFVLDLVETAFPDVASMINEEQEFETSPQLNTEDYSKFLWVVVAGNMKYIPLHLHDYQDIRVMDKIYGKLGSALGFDKDQIKENVIRYQKFLSKVNTPSKNILYSMSKGVFWKYELNDYQTSYFKNMKSPNPIFLKKMDEIMTGFLFNWEDFLDDYRIS